MQIRRATASELKNLVPLFDEYRIFYGKASDIAGATRFLQERFVNMDSIIFIASIYENDIEKYLGFTQLYPSLSSVSMQRILILNDLYVAPSARDHGIGEKLIQHAIQYGIANKINRLTLQTATDNLKAQNLYSRLGWVKENGFLNYQFDVLIRN